ncbi:putative methyltransferase C9orf114 [Aplysia californica]|uniref:Methyltransferase C9orf114 n=1 Tax=Aplysia californica TaxID=6500 RepID=A0ABM0JC55_APLCA|nr:putative methyltransferase C9orf114 [Aplysia californica]
MSLTVSSEQHSVKNKKGNTTSKNDDELSYKRTPVSVDELKAKKFSNKERKDFKRKWREEKLLAQMEKNKKQRQEKEQQIKKEEEEKKMRERCGRLYTVSIALPGSILDNAQSTELRAYLAGQVARAAAVFNVDEIVIFDEMNQSSQTTSDFSGLKKSGQGNKQLFHILQYLECPQYLRKSFFPYHQDLAHAGLLNPLDIPHHLRESDVSEYREGVTLKKPVSGKKDAGSYANIGLKKEAILNMNVPPGQRVTVKLLEQKTDKKNLRGEVVSPNEPREVAGTYWGYVVRLVSCLSEVFTSCPYQGGYDLTVGTSERGQDVNDAQIPSFKHAIIVFGGLKGLEASVEADCNIGTDDPSEIFQRYVNVCSRQGSRTIRTEEAILIAMTALSPKLTSANAASS